MKNLFKSMMLVAVAAMGFTACSKEAVEEVNPAIEKTFSLTISAEKPALESDTRTEFADGSVIWTDGDKVRAAYKHTAKGWSKYFASNQAVSEDGYKTATFALNDNFEPATEGGIYTFYAGYPNDKLNENDTALPVDDAVIVEVQTEQVMPKAGTFDAKADIMVGVSKEYNAWPTEAVALQFHRLVAHGCVTLKNLSTEDGELVKTVTFTAPDGVMLTGNGSVNLVEQTMSELSRNTVTIALPANTAANDNVVVWFCSAPATIASGAELTVTVETTRGTYTRTITANTNGIKFLQNRYNTLGINMAEAYFKAAAVSETVYKQITSMAELTSGEYVIAGLYNSNYYPMPANFTSKKISAKTTIIVNNGQITEADAKGYVVTLAVSTDGISISDGTYYLDWKSSTDFKTSSITAAYWTVTYESDMFKIIDNDTANTSTVRAILWQYNSGSSRFAPYATSNFTANDYSGLYLFKKTTGEGGGSEEPTPEASIESATIENVAATGGDLEYTPVISNSTSAIDENIQCDGTVVTEAIVEEGVVLYTVAENTGNAREGWFKLALADDASVTATITVKQLATEQGGGDEPGTGEEVTVTFNCTDFTYSGSGDTGIFTANDENVEIVQSKGNSSTAVNSKYNNPIRFYVGHNLTFTSTKTITKIVFTYDTSYDNVVAITKSAGNGTFSGPTDGVGTYTSTGDDTVVFTTTKQVRFTKIAVTYK